MVGAALPGHEIDGVSIWPILSGQPEARSPHEALFFYYQGQLQALRAGRWKLHFPRTYRFVAQAGADGMPGTYIHPQTGLALYDLEADIGESHNVAAAHPDVVERLSRLADAMRAALGDERTGTVGSEIRPAGEVAVPER